MSCPERISFKIKRQRFSIVLNVLLDKWGLLHFFTYSGWWGDTRASSVCCLRQGWQVSMMLRGDRSVGHILWPGHSWDLFVLEDPKHKVCFLIRVLPGIRNEGLKSSISTTEQEAALGLSPVAFLVIFHALNNNVELCDFSVSQTNNPFS